MIYLKKNEIKQEQIEIKGEKIEIDRNRNDLLCNSSKDVEYVLIKIERVKYFLRKDVIGEKIICKTKSQKIIGDI